MTTKPNDIDEYIAGFPKDIQKILAQIRETIKKAAPGAEETIKYAIPTYILHGNLVHFAAFKNHIGFYPAPAGTEALKKEISVYKVAKATIRFPLDKPIPINLITKMVEFRVKENLERVEIKKGKYR